MMPSTVRSSLQPADRRRSVALGASALSFVLVPTLGPALFDSREDLDRYDTAITPPGYAFSIWGPIFAACVVSTAQAVRPSRMTDPESRAIGWPLAGAYALNALWSVAAQTDRFKYTPGILATSALLAGVAHWRLQDHPPQGDFPSHGNAASLSTGLLLGWTGLAATVILSAGTQLLGADPTSRSSVRASTLGAGVTAAALCRLIHGSNRGYLPLAGSALWGLTTTALDAKRPLFSRLGAATGAVGVLASALERVRARRPGPVR